MMRRYGTPMTLEAGAYTYSIRAFIQDTQSRAKENVEREFSPLGEISKGMYIYIGPVTPAAEAGDHLVTEDRSFVVLRAENVMVGDRAAYRWGLCREKGGEGTWGS